MSIKMTASLLFLIFVFTAAYSQNLTTKNAFIGFYSKTPLEDIKAENNQVYAVIDAGKKNIAFTLLVKGFVFAKELMQEHFNEDYIESDKFPKAVYTGTIKNAGDLKLDKDGVYKVQVSGSLTIHGVTKPQDAEAVFTVKGGAISAVAEFTIAIADYNIKIPSLVAEKVSKTVKIVVNVSSYQAR